MPNFLEQLVAEWYEYQGYFVRRNVKVGKRAKGGHDGELDVVAFHPAKKKLVHIEPSMDAMVWSDRIKRYQKKFDLGRQHIPTLFESFQPLPPLESIAFFVQGSAKANPTIGGGKVQIIGELMSEIREEVRRRKVLEAAVPEQFVILRTLQFAANYWKGQMR